MRIGRAATGGFESDSDVLVAAGGTKTVTGSRSQEAQPGRSVSGMLPSPAQGTAPPPRPRDSPGYMR
jgi:hypothetical protein